VFGDRWSLLVIRDIVFGDRRYFRELQASSEEGSPQIFSPTDSSDLSSWDC
jgi:DNA-binding HxlR family transcriptional regulator